MCTPKKVCTLDEIPKIYDSNCTLNANDNQLYKTYKLTNFKSDVCIIDNTVDTNKTYTVPCGQCEAGSAFEKQTDGSFVCKYCPSDKATQQQVCSACSSGSYLQRGISLSQFESFPKDFNFTTNCYNKDINKKLIKCAASNGFITKYQ